MSKINIFISSVIGSLEKERATVAEAIKTRHGLFPVFAEDFPAHDDPPIDICRQKVQDCNIYIGIFDREWGYIPKKDNPEKLSITAMEYYWAKEKSLPKFIFVSKRGYREPLLRDFIENIMDTYKGHWCKKYDSILQLRSLVLAAIDNILVERFHAGDEFIRKAVKLDDLKLIDSEKRKRDKIAKDLLGEVVENKERLKIVSVDRLHEFDTDIWNKNRGNMDFLGSVACTSLLNSYIAMKEQNNYLDGIKNARDIATQRDWEQRYANRKKLDFIYEELQSSEEAIKII